MEKKISGQPPHGQHLELEHNKKINRNCFWNFYFYVLHPLLFPFSFHLHYLCNQIECEAYVVRDIFTFSEAGAHQRAIEAYSLIKNSLKFIYHFLFLLLLSCLFSVSLFSSFWHSREYNDTPRARQSHTHTHSRTPYAVAHAHTSAHTKTHTRRNKSVYLLHSLFGKVNMIPLKYYYLWRMHFQWTLPYVYLSNRASTNSIRIIHKISPKIKSKSKIHFFPTKLRLDVCQMGFTLRWYVGAYHQLCHQQSTYICLFANSKSDS